MKTKSKAKAFDPSDFGLKSDSFIDAESIDLSGQRGLVMSIEAGAGEGKTHFALDTTPASEPKIIFNHDNGLRGVIEQFLRRGDKIIVAGDPNSPRVEKGGYPTYQIVDPETLATTTRGKKDSSDLDKVKEAAYPMWQRSVDDYYQFLESDIPCGIIDTGSAWFQLGKLAFHGMSRGVTAKDDPYGQKGGEMKSIFKGLIQAGVGSGKIIIWLQRVKPEWADGQATGDFVLDGHQETPFEVEVAVRMKSTTRKGVTTRRGEIYKTRFEGDTYKGFKFGGPDEPEMTFASIAATVTGTEESFWSE